ncbi:MAG: GNAT family N-acetyltransferase [Flavobacteriaceae bacterium]|nr:GNAT family N-acetyltransferase [Flavobacteriaceae bacterium]
MPYKIRMAKSDDMSAVLKLIKELADFENEPNAVEVSVADLVNDYENKLFSCLVAEAQSTIVGIALYYHRYSTWKGKTIHLEDLMVTKNQRGKGVGKALLNAVVEKAKAANLKRVEWNVLDWNTPAIDFYKSVGATVFNDWLVVQLDEKGINNY